MGWEESLNKVYALIVRTVFRAAKQDQTLLEQFPEIDDDMQSDDLIDVLEESRRGTWTEDSSK